MKAVQSFTFNFLNLRHFAISSSVQQSARFLFVCSSPLLKKERNIGLFTLCLYILHPFFFHRPWRPAALTTHYYPINSTKIQIRQWSNQGFTTEELCFCFCLTQQVYALNDGIVFNRYSHPDI